MTGTAGSGADPVGATDALLAPAYARFGWRLPLLALAGSWALVLAVQVAGSVGLIRFLELSREESLDLMAVAVPSALAAIVIGWAASLRMMRPLRAWFEGGQRPVDAPEAWRVAQRLPVQLVRAAFLAGLAIAIPASLVAIGNLRSLDAAAVAVITLDQLATFAIGAIGGVFGVQLLTRPAMREIADVLDRPPLPSGGASVRLKTLFLVPVIAIDALFFEAWLTAAPGGDWGRLLGEMALAAAIVLPAFLPATWLLARSTLTPLEDLLRATERLQRGDFDTRVPELSGDEYGVLARSFNEAMEGLSERQRLATANERLLQDVRASRTRIVAAADAAARRIERNIHDGAQQRLVALSLDLRMLEEATPSASPEELQTLAARAGTDLKAALEELRELARGLHPSVLETDGLPPALKQLAARAPVPVEVSVPRERLAPEVESTAYFLASEALANIAKHAQASRAEVLVERRDGRLVIQIADDGVGGAHAGEGSGLAGLTDRLAALDGVLTIESPPGRGTLIEAQLPLEPDGDG